MASLSLGDIYFNRNDYEKLIVASSITINNNLSNLKILVLKN